MARFPKIGETNTFPYLDNARPFDRHVTFDYSRYDYAATAKLCKVPWPNDYRHAVWWLSEQMRDTWFEDLEGLSIELTHGTLRTQTDAIRLDVPYDVALTYNYIYMKVPQLTEDALIDHERAGGVRTVCAFIDSCEYQSPSATLFRLSVDVWTTYMPYTSVHGMMLDRGHAPMWAMSASSYLQNPIANCGNLLAPDVSFGDAGIVRGGDYEPLSTANPIYVLASTIPYGQINGITRAYTHNSTAATYYDTGARNGEQVGVRSYQWGSGKGYDGMTSPSTPTHADGSIPSGLYYYGVLGTAVANGALATIFDALPVLATSCQAAFVVPSDLVTLGTTHAIEGVTVYEVSNKGLQEVASFDVTKQLFGYPTKYADIAKLYTEPYAHLEISDDLGNSTTIAIEDTSGTVDVSQMLSIAFPAIEWRAAVTNVANTGGDVRYAWKELDGTSKQKTFPNADLASTFIDYGIPTYALYLEARTTQALRTWADAQQQRASAIVAYQSTMRSANTAEQNAYDSNATAKTNADASADTGKANADASADTNVANVARSGNNSTANTNIANNLRSTTTALSNSATDDISEIQAQGIFDLGYADDEYTMLASDTNLKSEAVAATANMAGSAASGNGIGVLSAGISGIVNITTSSALASLSSANIVAKEAINQGITRDVADRQQTLAGSLTVANNSAATNTNTNNVNTANANAQASAATAKANASRSQATSKANASRSQATGNSNANYSRDTTEENAKATLENARAGYDHSLTAASVETPTAHGSYAGTSVHEIWENRGIHLRGITQAAGAIKQAGDTFLRYGYMLNAAWDVESWVPTGHTYCYWQSTDLWQNVADVDNTQAERMLEAILAAGVTVWDTPEHVGRFETS